MSERLTSREEQMLRQWPRERIKPLTVARCLDSVLAELAALRARVAELEAERERMRAALKEVRACLDHLYTARESSGLARLDPALSRFSGPISIIDRVTYQALAQPAGAREAAGDDR